MRIKLFGKSVKIERPVDIIPSIGDEVWYSDQLEGHVINIFVDHVEVQPLNKSINKTYLLSELTQRKNENGKW